MNSPMIRYLWFDLGYTLVKTNREDIYRKTLETLGIVKTRDEITIAYHLADKLFMREYRGVLGKDSRHFLPWYIGVLNYYLGLSLPIEEVISLQQKAAKEKGMRWTAFDFSKPTLRSLKEAGYRLGLISNWDGTAREVLKANRLDEEFDFAIISSEIGIEKPDPAIFEIALSESGATAEQSLYVGDNYYDDVVGSRQAGMDCLLINPYGTRGIEELNYDRVISSIREVAAYLSQLQGVGSPSLSEGERHVDHIGTNSGNV